MKSEFRSLHGTSIPEKTVLFYAQKYYKDVQYNVRFEELDYYEIDVYLPLYKIAIEYDGGAWHKDTSRDLRKDILCFNHGIKLIRIREKSLADYLTSAIIIKTDYCDANFRFMVPVLDKLFKKLNELTGSKHNPVFNIDRDYSAILELVDRINYEQSLAVKNPDVAKEWDYTKNKSLKPEDVASASSKRVWWICEKGHSFRAAVYQRKKCGCPYCSNKKVLKGYNDLETIEPEIAKEWDYSKNNLIKPSMVSPGTSKKVWWLCNKGHSWRTSVSNRTNKDNRNKCPYCTGQRPIVGENDLLTVNPDLAKQWDYEKNGTLKPTDVMISSGKTVWWICEKGHSFKAAVYTRRNSGCPYCGNKKVLKGFNDVETLFPHLTKDWHPTLNDGKLPSDFIGGSNTKVWWKCSICGYEWKTEVNNRTYGGHGCPACTHQVVRKKVKGAAQYDSIGRPMNNDLATVRPDLIKEWDYERNGDLKPDDVNAGADKKVWWICERDHHYLATIYQRATREHQTNCPYCSNKKVLKGYNDLATLNPTVAKEWDYEKNNGLLPEQFVISSGKKVWWKCKTCGNSWEAIICNRTSKHNKNGCPYCLNQKIKPGFNDLATLYPNLMDEWDYEKNTLNPHEISGGTNKKAWWKCKTCGNSWETSIPVRTKMNGGCPKCSAKRRGKLRSVNAKKPLIQLSLDGMFIKEWPSALEASSELGMSATNIRECASGNRNTAGGFKWKYK